MNNVSAILLIIILPLYIRKFSLNFPREVNIPTNEQYKKGGGGLRDCLNVFNIYTRIRLNVPTHMVVPLLSYHLARDALINMAHCFSCSS